MLARFATTAACISDVINGAYFEVALAFFLFAFFARGCCALFFADIRGVLGPASMQADFMVHVLAQVVKAAYFNRSFPVLEHVHAFIIRAGQAAGDGATTAFVFGMLLPGILVGATSSTAGLRR